eukprot:g77806.t1
MADITVYFRGRSARIFQVIKLFNEAAFKEADEEVKQMASRIPLMTAILTNLTQIWEWDKTCEKPIKQFAENLLASVEAIERHQRSSFGWGATETNKTLKSLASHQDRLINTINCWILTEEKSQKIQSGDKGGQEADNMVYPTGLVHYGISDDDAEDMEV